MKGQKEPGLFKADSQTDIFNPGRSSSLSAILPFNTASSSQGRFVLRLLALVLLSSGLLCASLKLIAPWLSADFSACSRILAEHVAPRGSAPVIHVSQKLVEIPQRALADPGLPGERGGGSPHSAPQQGQPERHTQSFFGKGGVLPLPSSKLISQDPLTDYLARKTRVLGDACGFSAEELLEIVSRPHGARRGERRYFTRDQWMDIASLHRAVEWHRRRHVAYGETVCILAHLWGTVPCAETPCLVPMHVRPHFTDFNVMKQLLERGDFNFLYGYNFSTILDAGANVGIATQIFSIQFPEAKVVAVELCPENYRVLQRNAAFLPNVIAVNAGLHNSVKTLSFSHDKGTLRQGWNYMLSTGEGGVVGRTDVKKEEVGSTPIKTITMDLLMQLFDIPSFDFIKMDVEGSEKEIFTQADDLGYTPHKWIGSSKLLTIETHDKVKAGSSKAVEDSMSQHAAFVGTKVGEYVAYYDQKQIQHPLKHAWGP